MAEKTQGTLWVLLQCEPSDVVMLYQHAMAGGVVATRIFQLSSREVPAAYPDGQAGETARETEMTMGGECQSHLCSCQQHLVSG